jgi:hypothetical protein
MFRMEFEEFAATLVVRIEGRFVGAFADEAKHLIIRRKTPRMLTVDLTEMTFVDSAGEETLMWLAQIGAKFIAESSYALDVCERLHLRLARNYRIPVSVA